jgi:hypothetical protein
VTVLTVLVVRLFVVRLFVVRLWVSVLLGRRGTVPGNR